MQTEIRGSLKVFRKDPRAKLPIKAKTGSRGWDLCCLEDFTISPGETLAIDTGLVVQPPPGYAIDIRPRSGLASKGIHGSLGTIEANYHGPTDMLRVILTYPPPYVPPAEWGQPAPLIREVPQSWASASPWQFRAGDRIAQFVLVEDLTTDLIEVPAAPGQTSRGGLGSTGVRSDDLPRSTRPGVNWTPPAGGEQTFAAYDDVQAHQEGRTEICTHCGKHLSQHHGLTEYRCHPRPDAPIGADRAGFGDPSATALTTELHRQFQRDFGAESKGGRQVYEPNMVRPTLKFEPEQWASFDSALHALTECSPDVRYRTLSAALEVLNNPR